MAYSALLRLAVAVFRPTLRSLTVRDIDGRWPRAMRTELPSTPYLVAPSVPQNAVSICFHSGDHTMADLQQHCSASGLQVSTALNTSTPRASSQSIRSHLPICGAPSQSIYVGRLPNLLPLILTSLLPCACTASPRAPLQQQGGTKRSEPRLITLRTPAGVPHHPFPAVPSPPFEDVARVKLGSAHGAMALAPRLVLTPP